MCPAIVFSTSSVFPNTELGFKLAAEFGYDGVEGMVNHEKRSQSPESIRDMAKTYEMPVKAVHVPCLVISQPVWGWSPEVKLRKSIELAREVDARTVVVHPPFRWQREYAQTLRQVVIDLCQEYDGEIEVAVENMYSVEKFGRRIEPYLWNEDPALGGFPTLCYDTSHAAAARLDIIDLYRRMQGRVSHIHLSDSTATKGDEHLPPGMGTLPLHEFADVLLEDAFEGDIVLEVATGKLPESLRHRVAADCLEWTRQAFGRD